MSLLVASCTMGQQPDRLLDKGPQYLRTRTNRGLFAHHRKSAVELLAASKSQFYKCPSVSLDDAHHVNQVNQSEILDRSDTAAWQEKKPSRSKSEYDIAALQSLIANESKHEDNDDVFALTNHLEREPPHLWTSHQEPRLRKKSCEEQQRPSTYHSKSSRILRDSCLNSVTSSLPTTDHPSLLKSDIHIEPKVIGHEKEQIFISTPATEISNLSNANTELSQPKKPVPLPRKLREKPVPPPRKPIITKETSNKDFVNTPSLGVNKSRKCSLPTNNTSTQPETVVEEKRRKFSLVENLRKHFTSEGGNDVVTWTDQIDEKTVPSAKNGGNDNNHNICKSSEEELTYQATPIFIAKPQSGEENGCFQAKPVVICTEGSSLFLTEDNQTKQSLCDNKNTKNVENAKVSKVRKGYPNASMSNKSCNKRERKGSNTDSIIRNSPGVSDKVEHSPPDMSSMLTPGVIVEMSIESVDQVVCCDSEVNAIPAAITTSADSLGGEQSIADTRETNRNSILHGKMDVSLHEASLCPTHSPTHFNPSLPRSHSDISCRLEVEGHHSRDSSLVSNHSRLSRASAGADLEQFFNQMGLEKGVLEPLTRLRELQNSEVLASVSSLDSHDAASICSSFSDNDNSESQTLECSQHPTSVVERNARIIKWLCNVRKAKTQPMKIDAAVSDLLRAASAATDGNG